LNSSCGRNYNYVTLVQIRCYDDNDDNDDDDDDDFAGGDDYD